MGGIEGALVDYYRCPEQFVKMSLVGELSADAGYFGFAGCICFGQSSVGHRKPAASDALYDTTAAVSADAGLLHVPFDPSQIVDNFRLERYSENWRPDDSSRRPAWFNPYHVVRRFMPAPLRRALQRTYFRDWQRRLFPRWPVDDTVDRILRRLLVRSLRSQGIDRVPFVWFWPDGALSCTIVTHDVEEAAGRDRCSWLMDVDDRHGIKSSFQVIPEERYTVSETFLHEIRSRGFEVNLHDLNHDGRLFTDHQEFLRRARRINAHTRAFGARGFRSGSLYRHPDWYGALEIAYDMSIPNAAHLEIQRGGCCTVMPYFVGDIVELPVTTTQDYSLLHILRDVSGDVWKKQIEFLMDRHGLVSLIVHPDYLDTGAARDIYRGLLDHLCRVREQRRSWIALPGDVERWWRERSRMTVVRGPGGWRVEGVGNERARLAYAALDGDDVAYTIDPPPSRAERPSGR